MTQSPRRVNFVDGQLLSAADLQGEQDYHRAMRYLQNRLHGHGVIEGLEVTVDETGVHIGSGVAVDAQGREIVVAEPRCLRPDPQDSSGENDVLAVWAQTPGRVVPGPDGEDVVTLWIERPEVMLAAPGQGPPDAVLLARTVLGEHGTVTVDHSVSCRHPLSRPTIAVSRSVLMPDLPTPVQAVVDAINTGDTEAFVAAFAEDGYVDDWGRVLSGPDGVRGWAQTDAIGMDAQMKVLEASIDGDTTTIRFDWTSQRFNGTSTAIVTVRDDLVASFQIPPHS